MTQHVNVLVGDLYITIFDAALANRHIGHGREGYYFGENGEHTLYDVGKGIGLALVELGRTITAEPTTFTPEDIGKYLGVRPERSLVCIDDTEVRLCLTGINVAWFELKVQGK